MDELIDVVAGSLEISTEPNKTSTSHPRFSQFKSKSSKQDQNSRRAQILDIQKKYFLYALFIYSFYFLCFWMFCLVLYMRIFFSKNVSIEFFVLEKLFHLLFFFHIYISF